MDGQTLYFEEPFDLITSFTALQWIEDHNQLLHAVKEHLLPGGTFAVTMPMGLPSSLQQAVDRLITSKRWSHYFSHFQTGWNFVTEEGYRKQVENADLKIEQLQVVRQEDLFPSLAAFKSFISQWFPYLRPLPEQEKQVFLNELLADYLEKEPLDSEGQTTLQDCAVRTCGTRLK